MTTLPLCAGIALGVCIAGTAYKLRPAIIAVIVIACIAVVGLAGFGCYWRSQQSSSAPATAATYSASKEFVPQQPQYQPHQPYQPDQANSRNSLPSVRSDGSNQPTINITIQNPAPAAAPDHPLTAVAKWAAKAACASGGGTAV